MKAFHSLFNLLERAVPIAGARRAANYLIDKWQGLDTHGNVLLKDLGIADEDRVHYAPSGWFTLPRIGKIIPFSPDDTFFDFGSGKGRVVVMAAKYYAFKRVVGVEISAALNRVAQSNVEKNRRRLKCQQVELITCDALQYAPPVDMTIAYFYSPFTGAIFRGVVENIRKSLDDRQRRLWVVLQRPIESPRLAVYNECNDVLRQSSWLTHVDTVMTNSHYIAVYKHSI